MPRTAHQIEIARLAEMKEILEISTGVKSGSCRRRGGGRDGLGNDVDEDELRDSETMVGELVLLERVGRGGVCSAEETEEGGEEVSTRAWRKLGLPSLRPESEYQRGGPWVHGERKGHVRACSMRGGVGRGMLELELRAGGGADGEDVEVDAEAGFGGTGVLGASGVEVDGGEEYEPSL